MFCPKCGKKLDDDAMFCENCGTARPTPPLQTTIHSSEPPIEGTDIVMLLKRGFFSLEDQEWNTASRIFDYVLTLDIECADVYLGKVLAEQHCPDFEALIKKILDSTAEAEGETVFACEKDCTRCEEAINKYKVDAYLTKQEIYDLFDYDVTYQSTVRSRTRQREEIRKFFEENKTLKRILRFAEDDLKTQIILGRERIYTELNRRVTEAEAKDAESVNKIKNNYATHLTQAEQESKRLYDEAIQQREIDYQKACTLMDSAQTKEEYEKAEEQFDLLFEYKDSQTRSEHCHQQAISKCKVSDMHPTIGTEQHSNNKRGKWPVLALCFSAIGIITLAVVLSSQQNEDNLQEPPSPLYTVLETATPVIPPSPTPQPTPEPMYDINGNLVPDSTPNYYSDEWLAVDAYILYNEWSDNPVRAQLEYDGHWVRICYPCVSDISEQQIYVDDTLFYGCTITFHIDDISEAIKTSKNEYPVIAGYFVVEEDTKNFHIYHSQVLDSIDHETWSEKRYSNGLFGDIKDVTVGWRAGESPEMMGSEGGETVLNNYLYPSDSQYITPVELNQYTREEIVLIRNEIYARHGYSFSDADIRTYFESKSWYQPIDGLNASTFDSSVFNEYESANLDTILAYEKERGWRQ